MTNDEWTFATGQDRATGVAVLHNVITGIYIILCHGIDNYDSESIYSRSQALRLANHSLYLFMLFYCRSELEHQERQVNNSNEMKIGELELQVEDNVKVVCEQGGTGP
jgi:hypothetical protein